MEKLFARFHEQLAAQGYAARAGQMTEPTGDKSVAATFIDIPRQRNNRDENAEIKTGVTPEAWQA